MTTTAPDRRCERERHAIQHIFGGWNCHLLERLLDHLVAVPVADPRATNRALLNAQISVDTAAPGRLRFTMDPLAGDTFADLPFERAIQSVRALGCEPLEASVAALYEAECHLPQNLWIGLAPAGNGHVLKAYISDRRPGEADNLSRMARAAGWMPPCTGPDVSSLYERLVPFFADVEGVGISFKGDRRLGTTVYLRATRPWSICVSDEACAFLGICPAGTVQPVTAVFGRPPAVFGWSVECDPDGGLVDVKLEMKVDGWYNDSALADYARARDIDATPITALADAIARASLSERPDPSPAFLSLRLVRRDLCGVVAYFPLTPLGALLRRDAIERIRSDGRRLLRLPGEQL
jgi:hypothetical protein